MVIKSKAVINNYATSWLGHSDSRCDCRWDTFVAYSKQSDCSATVVRLSGLQLWGASVTYTCPICGDYEAPTPGAVKAHITAKTGEHKGESGPDYSDNELATDSDSEQSSNEQGSSSDNNTTQEPPQEPQQAAEEDPAKGGPEPDVQETSTSGEPQCPDDDCGSNRYALVDQYAEKFALEERYRSFDYICVECGELYND